MSVWKNTHLYDRLNMITLILKGESEQINFGKTSQFAFSINFSKPAETQSLILLVVQFLHNKKKLKSQDSSKIPLIFASLTCTKYSKTGVLSSYRPKLEVNFCMSNFLHVRIFCKSEFFACKKFFACKIFQECASAHWLDHLIYINHFDFSIPKLSKDFSQKK